MNYKFIAGQILLSSSVLIGVFLPTDTAAKPLHDRVCSFYKNDVAVERKTCKVDYFNGGMIMVVTNNGTLNFEFESGPRPSIYRFAKSNWLRKVNTNTVDLIGSEEPSVNWDSLTWSE